jgi:hypothetical protein
MAVGPSKKFIIRGSIALGIVICIVVSQSDWFRKLIHKDPVVKLDTRTVGEIVEKDSNGNGIPDWEEKLWGLDPTILYTNGVPNSELIAQKKRALGLSNTGDSNLNETDRLARELYTLSTALGQSNVDPDALAGAASKLSDAVPIKTPTNRYSSKDIKTISTSYQSLQNYRTSIAPILNDYSAIAGDIDTVVQAFENEDTASLVQLRSKIQTYRTLAKRLLAIPAPILVASAHLSIINGLYGIGDSFSYLAQTEDNSVQALSGIALYQSHSLGIQQGLVEISNYFIQYGILQ